MRFANINDIKRLQNDYKKWFLSSEMTVINLHWIEHSAVTATVDPAYNDYPLDVDKEKTLEVVGGVQVLTSKEIQYSGVEHKSWGNAQAGDALFFFDTDVDLEGKEGLTLEVENGGTWAVELVPPEAFGKYQRFNLMGITFAQVVFGRLQR